MLELVAEAKAQGLPEARASQVLQVSPRTLQRWRRPVKPKGPAAPRPRPTNALTRAEAALKRALNRLRVARGEAVSILEICICGIPPNNWAEIHKNGLAERVHLRADQEPVEQFLAKYLVRAEVQEGYDDDEEELVTSLRDDAPQILNNRVARIKGFVGTYCDDDEPSEEHRDRGGHEPGDDLHVDML